jgi:hypothetical protein
MTDHPASPPEQKQEQETELHTETKSAAPARERTRARSLMRMPVYIWQRTIEAIATVIVVAAVTVAIILVVHIVFVVFDANTANSIVDTINGWADTLAWKFKDVFTPESPKTAALVNFGLAAVIYLIVGRIVAGLIRRAG